MENLLKKRINVVGRGISMFKFLGNLSVFILAFVMYPLFVSCEYLNGDNNPFTRPNHILSESFKILFRRLLGR